ncbi:hypothetical protein ABZ027_19370 [Streptomyces sp. NPDC006332]|uniref:hypothetical protein n=1 Tax=Streptomyces sp. NPDC006332 TaxID=3155456 RepID=UPI0033A14EE9
MPDPVSARSGRRAVLDGDGPPEQVVATVAENAYSSAVRVPRSGAHAFSFGAGTLGTVANGARLDEGFPR